MTNPPSYDELAERVRQLEAENQRLAGVEAELKRNLHFTHSLLASIPTPVFYKDARGRYLGCNPAFSELMGVTPDQIRSKTVEELWPSAHAATYHQKDLELIRNPAQQIYEFEVRDRHGAHRPVIFYKDVFRDEQGQVAGLVGGFLDISELRRAEAELQAIFTMSLDMLCIADIRTGTFLKVNPAFTATLGYSEAELRGRPFAAFIHPEDIGPTQTVLEERLQKGEKVINFRNRYRHKDGDYRWLNWVSHPLTEQGLTYAVAHDITAEIETQEEIRERRMFLESVLYHAPDAIVTMDARHHVVDWNPGAEKMFGFTPEEAMGRQLDNLVAGQKHKNEAGAKTRKVLSGQRVEAFETVRYRKDGTPLNVIAAGSPILMDGVLKGVVAVYTDITDRVQAEQALHTSHQRFLTVMDSIDATIYVADMETHEIIFMNRNMIENFGRDMTGEICWQAFRDETGPCPNCTNHQLVDDRGQPTGVHTWKGRNPANNRWYINYDRAIEWTDGRLVRLQIAVDITENQKMEAAFQRAQKMEAIGTLAGGIAHDFNNLLTGIQGYASLMKVDQDIADLHREQVLAIESYVNSARNLTAQLLGIARGGKYEIVPVDINTLMADTAALFGRTRKEIQLHQEFQATPLIVEVDRRQIEQVVLNIFINAMHAMTAGGELFLRTSAVNLDAAFCEPHHIEAGAYVKVSITDTGIGMDADTQQKIFDPFFTTKQKGRGTGLGLASAFGIVNNHGGTITVYSEPGHGATFNIYLPASGKQAGPETVVTDQIVTGSEMILLVDDEEMIRMVASAMLKKLGYEVIVASTGTEAVDMVARQGNAIALVILDMIMPGMDGNQTFDRLREIRPQLPVLLSSGYAINGQAIDIMQKGCNGFIQKPFSISELSQKIRHVLDKGEDAL